MGRELRRIEALGLEHRRRLEDGGREVEAEEGTAIEPPLQEGEVCATHGGPGRRDCCGRRG